jgi:nicotinamidase-related amidase
MARAAVIVIDMLNDFVTGPLRCARAERIIVPLQRLLAAARAADVPIIYANDAHLPGIDKEFRLWGPHAVRGSHGAEAIPALAPGPADYVVPKRRYSAFRGTDLALLLRELEVGTVVLTGLHCNLCVRHTAADAYDLDLRIVVPTDATEAFTEDDYAGGLAYLKMAYGADLCEVEALADRLGQSGGREG